MIARRRFCLAAAISGFLFPLFADAEIGAADHSSGESASHNAPIAGKLVSVGSDTLGTLSSRWAELISEQHPSIRVQVRAIGSSAAPVALVEGTADLGPMSRPMTSAETRAFEKRYGYSPTAITIARDSIAVFVHRNNPLDYISGNSLAAVFSNSHRCGRTEPIEEWGQLGTAGPWRSRAINVYGRTSSSGTYSVFRGAILCGGEFKKRMNRLVGSSAIVRAVATDRTAIGYASSGYLNAGVKALRVVDTETGVERSLFRDLYLYINRAPGKALAPQLASYLKLVLSESGQRLVSGVGYQRLPTEELAAALEKLGIDNE
ncbi:MAG: PstS family phosphate ABC transporter substrate-binding protein [Pseudomonadota bacterium]